MQFWTQSLFRDNSADLSGLANWFITALLCSEDADDDNVGDSVGFLALGVTLETLEWYFLSINSEQNSKKEEVGRIGILLPPQVRSRARQRALWVSG